MNYKMKPPVYLDYAATTPVSDLVFEAMKSCLKIDGNFANPNSNNHSLGMLAAEAIDRSRYEVSDLVNCKPEEIIFVSGATEANNLAIRGAAYSYSNKGRHIITASTEHKSVLESCRQLEREGYEVTYLKVNDNGLIDLNFLEKAIREDTILVSVMHVNNEIGVIQDIHKIGSLLKNKGVLFHVDAAQSAGKLTIDLSNLHVDMMSFSAHKVYGPKGVGALYINKNANLAIEPLIYGGGQERNLRSGTLPTHQIVGMGKAFMQAKSLIEQDYQFIKVLNQYFYDGLLNIPNVTINADRENCIPHILNFRIDGIEANELLSFIPDAALSVGSACNSSEASGSHVLRAIGLTPLQMRSSIRASFGRYTSTQELDNVLKQLDRVVRILLKNRLKERAI